MARLDYVWHRRTHRFARGSYVLLTRVGTVALAVGFLLAVPAAVLTADLGLNTWHVLSVVALVGTLLAAAAGFGLDLVLKLLDRSHDQGHGVHQTGGGSKVGNYCSSVPWTRCASARSTARSSAPLSVSRHRSARRDLNLFLGPLRALPSILNSADEPGD